MNRSFEKIPNYLKKYSVEQDYDSYTPQQHAAWRYIMRRARHFFKKHAVPCYLEGLKKTGITINQIPSIDDIDNQLSKLGWGAIGVCGFIPPAAFIDFQARGIMPIAMDMRSIQHIAYTPAPDIVHEAAGHVPILIDDSFRTFLLRYAKLADKAIITKEDVMLYEAIRLLSDIKENPDTTPGEIEKAEAALKAAYASITFVSEASQLARLAWWTSEYGLVGDLKSPLIYGAGLLSSVGESEKCLSSAVKKLPLTLDCLAQAYDITEPQPQLFVAKSLDSLPYILDEVEKKMAFKVGGKTGLELARKAESVNTLLLDSGISVSGILIEYQVSNQETTFLKLKGPVQLALGSRELAGHNRNRHPQGFSSPLGFWKKFPGIPPQTLTDSDLQSIGLSRGKKTKLEFASGFVIEGTLWHLLRKDGKLLCLTWSQCTVTRGDKVYFDPKWGVFDQIVGTDVTSVFAGPADRDAYGEYETGNVSTSPGRTSPYTDKEWKIFDLYKGLKFQREHVFQPKEMLPTLEKIAKSYTSDFREEWLIGIELLEVAKQKLESQPPSWKPQVEKAVQDFALHGQGVDKHSLPTELINHGLALINEPD